MSRIKKYKERVESSIHFRNFIDFLKNTHITGNRVPLWNFGKIFWKKLVNDEISMMAYGVAFNFTFAIFPSLIFMFTVIPYIPIENLNVKILDFLQEVVPGKIYNNAEGTINDIVSKPRGGLLSFGFFFALFLATNGMDALIAAFNACYKTKETRNYIYRRWISLILTVVLALILFLAIAILIIGRFALDTMVEWQILQTDTTYYLLYILKYLVIGLIFLLGVSVIYYWAPSIHKRWRFFSYGAILATVLCILVSLAYTFYFNHFASYNRLYGSIGAMIGLMLWLYFISFILLFGFELNASLEKSQILQQKLRQRKRNNR
ncbi:MAG: YihY/virulence factor BrkB family protein [Cytophagales bacterium]